MGILGRLALLFVVVPILELLLLIQVGGLVGWPATIGLVLLTGVTGAWLARSEGVRTLLAMQRELAEMRMPTQSLMDGVAILLGGAFLLTPGILTDLVGFSLLLPPTRKLIQNGVKRRIESGLNDGTLNVTVISSIPHSQDSDPDL